MIFCLNWGKKCSFYGELEEGGHTGVWVRAINRGQSGPQVSQPNLAHLCCKPRNCQPSSTHLSVFVCLFKIPCPHNVKGKNWLIHVEQFQLIQNNLRWKEKNDVLWTVTYFDSYSVGLHLCMPYFFFNVEWLHWRLNLGPHALRL